jgi:hypothetical protein
MSGSHSENQTTGKEVMISNQQKEKKSADYDGYNYKDRLKELYILFRCATRQ